MSGYKFERVLNDGYGYVAEFSRTWKSETGPPRFVLSTLEVRIANLERNGEDASEERKALTALSEAIAAGETQ